MGGYLINHSDRLLFIPLCNKHSAVLPKMSNYINVDTLNSNHLSRSIIISRSSSRPSFMSDDKFRDNAFPTPAMKTYEYIVSHSFSRFYWNQDPPKRVILVLSLCRELLHEGGGRIYKRHPRNNNVLIKLSLEEFRATVLNRLHNLRYKTQESDTESYFHYNFDDFSEGEQVMVTSPSNVMYNGTFQFQSVINNEYCYIKFDSRRYMLRWECRHITKINLDDYPTRRVTRHMVRERNDLEAASAHFTASEEIFNGERSYEGFISFFGNGTENKSVLDEKWLRAQEMTKNTVPKHGCPICLATINGDEIVYDVRCAGVLKHPLHLRCMQECVQRKKTDSCPLCREFWT